MFGTTIFPSHQAVSSGHITLWHLASVLPPSTAYANSHKDTQKIYTTYRGNKSKGSNSQPPQPYDPFQINGT